MNDFITVIIIAVIAVKYFLDRMTEDHVNAYAAQSAFFIFISFFPFLMLLVTLLQYLPFSSNEFEYFATQFIPDSIYAFIETIMNEVTEKSPGTVISLTTVTALWSSSKSIIALIQGLNSVYGVKERRNYAVLRLTAVLYMLVFIGILMLTLTILVFGSSIAEWISSNIPPLKGFFDMFLSLRWIIGFALLVLLFMFMYTVIPERKTKFIYELPGALISAAGWLGFSAVYSFYLENFASRSYLYGSLSAIVFLLLWLYFCMYIMLAGAEINDVICHNDLPQTIKRLKEQRKIKKVIKAKTRKTSRH